MVPCVTSCKLHEIHSSFFHTVAHRYDTAPSLGTVNQSSWAWQSSQLFCCSVSNISWKCHWNPLTNFSVMMLVSMDPENMKINQDCSLSHIPPVLKISWKSIYPFFFCNAANRHGFPRKNRKRNHVCKGLYRTSPKCSRLFLVPSPTYPVTFMKSVRTLSRNMANRQTNQQIGMEP